MQRRRVGHAVEHDVGLAELQVRARRVRQVAADREARDAQVRRREVRVNAVDERPRRPLRVDGDAEQALAVRDAQAGHRAERRDSVARGDREHLHGAGVLLDEEHAPVGQEVETRRAGLAGRQRLDDVAGRQDLRGSDAAEGSGDDEDEGLHGVDVPAMSRPRGRVARKCRSIHVPAPT